MIRRILPIVGVAVAVTVFVLVAIDFIHYQRSQPPAGQPDRNVSSYTDEHGRLCTQVDPPGDAISIDCDFPR